MRVVFIWLHGSGKALSQLPDIWGIQIQKTSNPPTCRSRFDVSEDMGVRAVEVVTCGMIRRTIDMEKRSVIDLVPGPVLACLGGLSTIRTLETVKRVADDRSPEATVHHSKAYDTHESASACECFSIGVVRSGVLLLVVSNSCLDIITIDFALPRATFAEIVGPPVLSILIRRCSLVSSSQHTLSRPSP